ncbi:hypothetical protein N9459_03835 [Flavobacteriaceae bacterium]|nr:hypothetical protein [Flavobacteriaceae bacterium]
MESPTNNYVIGQFSDLYEKAMSNKKTMDEGRKAAEFFRKLGWMEDARRTKTGRATYPTYGKKRT